MGSAHRHRVCALPSRAGGGRSQGEGDSGPRWSRVSTAQDWTLRGRSAARSRQHPASLPSLRVLACTHTSSALHTHTRTRTRPSSRPHTHAHMYVSMHLPLLTACSGLHPPLIPLSTRTHTCTHKAHLHLHTHAHPHCPGTDRPRGLCLNHLVQRRGRRADSSPRDPGVHRGSGVQVRDYGCVQAARGFWGLLILLRPRDVSAGFACAPSPCCWSSAVFAPAHGQIPPASRAGAHVCACLCTCGCAVCS